MTTTAAARSSGAKGSGCGCDTSPGPVRGTSFVRPRFFGGMLLTETDLQAVDDYVMAKRRLTNRSVLGAGVVCGLEVSCDPCGAGTVLVSPGYAIDCCGNDVVVECPETVDVLALVRELRARQGIDCGQPCADDDGSLEYVLNLVYTEELSEPVAPYTTDDCGVGDCDYSRVREGYTFELSCEAPDPEPSLVDHTQECMGLNRDETDKDSEQMLEVVRVLAPVEEDPESQWQQADSEVVKAWRRGVPFTVAMEMIPTGDEFTSLSGDQPDLPQAVDLVSRSLAVMAADDAHAAGRGTPGVPINARRRSSLQASAQDLARRTLASGVLDSLSSAARERVERVLRTAADPHDLELIEAADLFSLTEHSAFSSDVEAAALAGARRMQAKVLQRMAQHGRGGCRDHDEVSRLRFDQVDVATRRDAKRLGRAYVDLFQRCLCDAINPPCPTCTDARIPLARLRVRGCEVVAVCSLERHWVHSPRALSYWFPVVEAVRKLLEERCCRGEQVEDETKDPYEEAKDLDEGNGRQPGLPDIRRRGFAAVRERELDRLMQTAEQAGQAIRPPEDTPLIGELMAALGDRIVTHDSHTKNPTGADEQQLRGEVAELSKMVAELRQRLDELEGGPS